MRVLLIKPFWKYPFEKRGVTYNRIWPPLSLLNCAALLESDGHEVQLLDAHAERVRPQDLMARVDIAGFDKVFLTSSSLDRWQCPNLELETFFSTVKVISAAAAEVYIMGYHGTLEPEKILDRTGVKALILGEPENTVREICRGSPLSKIKGVAYRLKNGGFSAGQRQSADLKWFPVPAFHLLKKNRYFYEILGRDFVLFEGSRGCRHNCSFCSRLMQGSGVRLKDVGQLCDEVELAVKKFGVRNAYFIDLNFADERARVHSLCDHILSRDIRLNWCCQTRPDTVDKELLGKMKRAGCRLIHYGIESGSDRLLRLLNKNITVDRIKEGVRLTRRSGIKTLCFFVLGFPGESPEERGLTFNLARELDPEYSSFHVFIPHERGFLRDENADEGRDSVNEDILRYSKRFHLRPAHILKRFFYDGFWVNWKKLRLMSEYMMLD